MDRDEGLPQVGAYEARARLALVPAIACVGVATWLVLFGHPRLAGLFAGSAAALLLFAALRASASRDRVLRFADSVSDRAFDGALLPAIAIEMRHSDMTVAALAVGAVGVSFLAAYMRARGWALGYDVGDSLLLRAGRYAAVAIGLVVGGLLGALIAVIALMLWTVIDEARQVAAQGA